MDTKDGYHFDEETGVTEGLPCEGVIVPGVSEPAPGIRYDAIVIGAGYAGLIAARDLAIRGIVIHRWALRKKPSKITNSRTQDTRFSF